MTLNLTIPQTLHTDFTPRITVIGVGGGGTNAVDNMISLNLQGVEFVVANTDAQQLMHSRADRRIQLGPHLTQGLGAGAKPEIGRAAAEEAADELTRHLDGAHMVFITAGMGGGTGTGAAPVIARMARERGILTVGVVTKPFTFEGVRRARAADHGITELQQFVDTLIVIPNQNLFRLATERTGWKEAFKMADHVLYMGVRGVTDLMVAPGLVNLDFADIRTVMAEMGKAMMGTGEAEGENRAIRAAEAAISNPLLEDTSMSGARGLLINITGGEDMTLFEVDQAANRIREEVAEEANIIFGSAIDEGLQGRIRVSVVATGIDSHTVTTEEPEGRRRHLMAVGGSEPVQFPQAAVTANPGVMGAPVVAPVQAHAVAPMRPMPVTIAAGASSQQVIAQPVTLPQEHAPGLVQPAALHQPGLVQPAALHQPGVAQPVLPAHAQPLPQASQAVRARSAAPRPGLFAATPTQDQPQQDSNQGSKSWQASHGAPVQPGTPAASGRSLFGLVTGAIRRTLPAGAPAASETVRTEPMLTDPQPSATVRPSIAQEEAGLDIPAFLRRQSS
jgi:cell division protein FtsZ